MKGARPRLFLWGMLFEKASFFVHFSAEVCALHQVFVESERRQSSKGDAPAR
jgi:hypothetical protein